MTKQTRFFGLKRILFLFISIIVLKSSYVHAENDHLKFYGFIRNDFFLDSYKGIDGAHEQIYLLPVFNGIDAKGEDINEQWSANMTAIATRMGVTVSGPELLGAATNANIEVDFGGIIGSEPSLLRIRKAFTQFNWRSASLLLGQDWHPFWGGDIFPTVASLNTGAPFQPFNRAPQICFTYHSGTFNWLAAALYQLQYTSPAFNSSHQSTANQAKRNGVLPELATGFEYRKNQLVWGGGMSYNRTKPKMTFESPGKQLFKSESMLNSFSYNAYLQYRTEKLKIQIKGILGQNLKHLLLPGGYGVRAIDQTNGAESYTNYNNIVAYINLVYGVNWQFGLFAGSGKNLGTSNPLADIGGGEALSAGFFTNVQQYHRFAPHIAYNVSKLRLMLEFEGTLANYGLGKINLNNGLYNEHHLTVNKRMVFVMLYMF